MRSWLLLFVSVLGVTTVGALRAADLPPGATARLGVSRYLIAAEATGLALSPDGKQVAVCLRQPTQIALLDAETGQERRRFEAPTDWGRRIAFTADGKYLCGTFDANLYDLKAERWLPVDDIQSEVHPLLAASVDGKPVIVGWSNPGEGKGRTISIWDASVSKKLLEIKGLEYIPQESTTLSPDGKVLVTSMPRRKKETSEVEEFVQIWDLTTGKELKRLRGESYVHTGALSPDGTLLVMGQGDTEVSVVELASGKRMAVLVGPILGQDSKLQFSADSKQLLIIPQSGRLQLREMPSGKRLGQFAIPDGVKVWSATFLTDGNVRAAGIEQGSLMVWDVPSGKVMTPTGGHRGAVVSLAYSRDGKMLLSASSDSVRRWNAATGEPIHKEGSSHELALMGGRVLLSPDGRYVLTGSLSRGLTSVLETTTGQQICEVDVAEPTSTGFTAAFAENNCLVTSGAPHGFGMPVADPWLRCWDLDAGRRIGRFPRNQDTHSIEEVALSPDGKILARTPTVIDKDEMKSHSLTLLDVQTGKVCSEIQCADERLRLLAFSPDGMLLAGLGDQIRVWRTVDGSDYLLLRVKAKMDVRTLTFSRDGRLLAACGRTEENNGIICVWELATCKVRAEFHGHTGGVNCLSFSRDNRMLATGGNDTTVLLWDLMGKQNKEVQRQGKPRADEFDALWNDLADPDAEKASRLMQRLAAHPAEATALVKAKLPPVKAPKIDAAEIDKLIAQLDDADFDQREKASKALAEIGKPASAALTKALQNEPSAEKKRRLTDLLDALKVKGPRPEMVRPTRALELLERLGTPEAQQVLEELAKGDPDAPLTHDAKATLNRLTAR
jgi:WD40 repeat protein